MTVEMSLQEMQSKVLNTLMDAFENENSPLAGYQLKGVSLTHKDNNSVTINFIFDKEIDL